MGAGVGGRNSGGGRWRVRHQAMMPIGMMVVVVVVVVMHVSMRLRRWRWWRVWEEVSGGDGGGGRGGEWREEIKQFELVLVLNLNVTWCLRLRGHFFYSVHLLLFFLQEK